MDFGVVIVLEVCVRLVEFVGDMCHGHDCMSRP